MKKNKVPKGVQQEFADIDYWHKLNRNKYVTLPDGSKLNEYEYMKRFMHEYYGKGFYDTTRSTILQTEEQKTEARRNNNNTNRDALLVSKKMGSLSTLLSYISIEANTETNKLDEMFKNTDYETCIKTIVAEFCHDTKLEYNITNVKKLLRFYFTIKRLLTLIKRDQRNLNEK